MIADPWVRALKLFVVIAGVVILAGTAALAWLLATGAGRGAPPGAEAPPARPKPPAPVTADLPLPAGTAIVDLQVDGERIVLLLRSRDGHDYLAVVDPTTGSRRALLRIVPETP